MEIHKRHFTTSLQGHICLISVIFCARAALSTPTSYMIFLLVEFHPSREHQFIRFVLELLLLQMQLVDLVQFPTDSIHLDTFITLTFANNRCCGFYYCCIIICLSLIWKGWVSGRSVLSPPKVQYPTILHVW
jgi:hypothetical protein